MAVKRLMLRDVVQRRNPSVRQQDIVKMGRARQRVYARPKGTTCTCSFTLTEALDLIVDQRAARENISRSAVVRQALMLADAHWSKR